MLLDHPGLVLFGTETRKRSKYHTFWGQILTEIPLGSYVSMWTLRENLKEPKRLHIRPKPIVHADRQSKMPYANSYISD